VVKDASSERLPVIKNIGRLGILGILGMLSTIYWVG